MRHAPLALCFIVTLANQGSALCATQLPNVGGNLDTSSHAPCPSERVMEPKGETKLAPNCVYSATAVIRQGNTTLDCQGSIIDPGDLPGYAVLVDSEGKSMSNVTIRNCHIRNANAIGIVVGWRAPDKAKAEQATREEMYQRHPRNVTIANTIVENSDGAGIYIDDYVSQVTVSHVSLLRNKSMGMYLEHSSRETTIEHSLFEENSVGKKREGLAIDSSASNVVRRNVFRGNKSGGVFLYKNCFEHAATDSKQVRRWQGADDNIIEHNLFENEPVGVWIASRQSIDLKKLGCGDPYYGERYVLDAAQRNVVTRNRFTNVGRGVVVEDDNNTVTGNYFDQITEVCVQVGSKPRAEILHRPVGGVTVEDNACHLKESSGKAEGVAFIYGATPAPTKNTH